MTRLRLAAALALGAGIALMGAARIAFRWSLLPTSQRFDAGDYNWGMTSFGLAPGTRFDLDLVWHRDGKRETGRLANVECPRDLQL